MVMLREDVQPCCWGVMPGPLKGGSPPQAAEQTPAASSSAISPETVGEGPASERTPAPGTEPGGQKQHLPVLVSSQDWNLQAI